MSAESDKASGQVRATCLLIKPIKMPKLEFVAELFGVFLCFSKYCLFKFFLNTGKIYLFTLLPWCHFVLYN